MAHFAWETAAPIVAAGVETVEDDESLISLNVQARQGDLRPAGRCDK